MKIAGNLIILTAADAAKYADVTEVGGGVYISADVTEVGGGVYISADGASLPLLAKVGGDVEISAAGASLPLLTEVGGGVYIRAAGVSLPLLTEVGGGVYIRAAGVSLPLLGRVIAWDGHYALFRRNDGRYCAGCRQGLTRDEALAHWKRRDRRAKMFTEAIKKETE